MGIMNSSVYKDHKIGDRVKPVTITGPGKTRQEFAKETDINGIMKRYNATGQLPALSPAAPVFTDVSAIGDYGDVLRRVSAANDAFASLPAEMRSRFSNEPANLVEFLQDARNYDEGVKLGLLVPRPVEPPAPITPTAVKPA